MKRILCAVAVLAAAGPLYADEQHDLCAFGGACRLTSEPELNGLRGGFDLDAGGGRRLRVDIGITREVSINNRVVATSHLHIPDLGSFMGPRRGDGPSPVFTTQAPLTLQLGNGGPKVTTDGQGILVQNGPNNTAPSLSSLGSQAMPVIVQNTLDNQKLSTLTSVTARVNSLQLLNTIRIGDMMNGATARSGR
jgi:hypothetical protein